MQYKIEAINQCNKIFHNTVVEPFEVFGRLEVSYQNNVWSHKEIIFDKSYIKSYKVEAIALDDYISSSTKVIFYALDNETVLGQIVIREHWNEFCLIEDIAVARCARQKGVASSLIDHAENWANTKNLKGFMLETQDVNLVACNLYIKNAFHIGSIDTFLYKNLECCNEKAIFWYKIF